MALPDNVTFINLLTTRQYERTDSLEVPASQDVEPYKVVLVDGTYGTDPTLITEIPYGISITAGIKPTEFGASATVAYFTVSRGDYATCQVEPAAAIVKGAPVTFATTGTGNLVTAGAGEHIIGYAMNASDGSGTALDPHYLSVRIDVGQLA